VFRRLIRWLCAPLLALTALVAGADGGRAAGVPNRLIDSGSLYLLQHAHNPVDWHPWGEEAFARARREDKPIFLSIGYSTCYWCHVAERTLFSVPEIAALMNAGFVNIKVDREQHPDVDQAYLIATQLLTGQVGWPNNLFLTPELKPFFAGSYFPPEDDHAGRPGFPTVLRAIAAEWSANRQRLEGVAERVAAAMDRANARDAPAPAALDAAALAGEARARLLASFDPEHGGFTLRSPVSRFPLAPSLALLADSGVAADSPLARTLDAMLLGGLFDHLGGGFHRYTVDAAWNLPHFEKMLYDNAQLLAVYARAHRATGAARYRDAARRTAEYLLGRMQDAAGGFHTAEDAQVDGHEGASYVWSEAEVELVLGAADAARFLRVYALTPLPEQDGEALLAGRERGALRVRAGAGADPAAIWQAAERLAPLRSQLLAARDRRPQPVRDDKIIVSLNALAIGALAEAGAALGERAWTDAAVRAGERVWRDAWNEARGELAHEIFRGRAQGAGYLDDYAALGDAFLTLAEVTGEDRWRRRAMQLADALPAGFARPDGGLRATRAASALPIAPEDSGDNAQPSGTSAALSLLTRLQDARHRDAAVRLAAHLAGELAAYPEEWPAALRALSAPAAQPVVAAASQRLAAAGAGEGLPAHSARHVRARGEWAERGGARELVVTVEVAPGHHVNANPASFASLIPTTLELGEAVEAIVYPAPKRIAPEFAREGIDVYEGRFEIRARLKPGAAPGTATLRVQACTDEACLLPARVPVALPPPAGG
jgi:uncharacterized protein YyaL (SSP411 family)